MLKAEYLNWFEHLAIRKLILLVACSLFIDVTKRCTRDSLAKVSYMTYHDNFITVMVNTWWIKTRIDTSIMPSIVGISSSLPIHRNRKSKTAHHSILSSAQRHIPFNIFIFSHSIPFRAMPTYTIFFCTKSVLPLGFATCFVRYKVFGWEKNSNKFYASMHACSVATIQITTCP